MIQTYMGAEKGYAKTTLPENGSIPDGLVRIDLFEPTVEEERAVGTALGMRTKGHDFKELLGHIGRNGDLTFKARESLVSIAEITNDRSELFAIG